MSLQGGELEKLSPNDFIKVLTQLKENKLNNQISLAHHLKKQGFSTEISGCDFVENKLLKEFILDDMCFTSCRFNWTHFSDSTLINSIFQGCEFLNSSFMNTSLLHCEFNDCIIRESMFVAALINNTKFSRCDMICSSFENAILSLSQFENITAPGTHFLDSMVSSTSIDSSNLQDAVFFGNLSHFEVSDLTAKTAKVSRPITAIPVYPEDRGVSTPKAYMKLDQAAKTIPIRIAVQPQITTKEGINKEVESLLVLIKANDDKSTPITQQLIDIVKRQPQSYPSIYAILLKVNKMSETVNAYYLPGGEDIPASLYGEDNHEKNSWGGDYRRSILEVSIINNAINKGIPMMAVCRGFQMSNVYFGSQLIQDIGGQKGVQKFSLANETQASLYGSVLKDSVLKSLVSHHQAIPQETFAEEHLDPSVIYNNLVKASELKHSGAVPAIMLQFHPEFYQTKTSRTLTGAVRDMLSPVFMSSSNDAFWQILSDSANTHRNLKDVKAELRATNFQLNK